MKNLFTLFSRRKQAPFKVDAGMASSDTTVVPVVRRPHVKTGQFELEIGDTEMHVLRGELISGCDMVLHVDSDEKTQRLTYYKRRAIEIHEGDIGDQFKVVVRVEREPGILPASKSKIRVTVNGRLAQIFEVSPKRTARSVVFQNIMPCLFFFVVFYYAFVFEPDVSRFYTQMLTRPPSNSHSPFRRHSDPSHPGKNQQMVAFDNVMAG